MKAIELNIVYEGDDGKTYVQAYSGGHAEYAANIIDDVKMAMDAEVGPSPPAVAVAVLRRVTEVEGHLDPDGLPYVLLATGDATCVSSICPDECFHPRGTDPQTYRFRFTVEAVRVPDPERAGREL